VPDWKKEIRNQLASLNLEPTREAEIVEELAQHLEDRYQELLAEGVSEAEAHHITLATLDDDDLFLQLKSIASLTQKHDSTPGVSGTSIIGDFWRDLRFAARMSYKSKGVTTVAILTLMLGIGANTAIFSVLNAVLLRPLPFKDPDSLVFLWTDDPKHSLHEEGTSYLNFKDWKEQNHSFKDLALCSRVTNATVRRSDELVQISAGRVSANLFSVLGVGAVVGRVFTSEEEDHGARVVVLSNELWQRWFGESAAVLDHDLEIDGFSYKVIGVMPQNFSFPDKTTQFWVPVRVGRQDRYSDAYRVIGRLAPGTSLIQAQVEMDAIGRRLASAYPTTDPDFAGFGVNIVPLLTQITGKQMWASMSLLLGAVTLVLLIACLNIANLQIARSAARRRELGIRLAIGASRSRLIRQLLTESGLVCFVGGTMSIAFAYASIRFLVAYGPTNIPRLNESALDIKVFAFTLLLTIISGVVLGLAPAIYASSTDPQSALASSRGDVTTFNRRTHNALVIVEFAFSVMLLVGTGLLLKSYKKVQSIDPGFQPEGLLSMRLSLSKQDQSTASLYEQLIEQVRALPGVQAAGLIEDAIQRRNPDYPITIEQRPSYDVDEPISCDSITPGLLPAIGARIVRGRDFSGQDRQDGMAVAIINETVAQHFWPGTDPLGKRFKLSAPQSREPWLTVVGIVANMRRQGLEKNAIAQVFVPQDQRVANAADLIVRTASSDPVQLAPAVRSQIRSLSKDVTISDVTTLDQRFGDFAANRRFQTVLLFLFSAAALLLAMIGIFGVTHYSVARRVKEIGVRMALGANQLNILRLIIGEGLRLALMGIAFGAAGSLAFAQVIRSLLFGVSTTDPVTFGIVTLLLIFATILACYLPARRATKVDPLVALRYE